MYVRFNVYLLQYEFAEKSQHLCKQFTVFNVVFKQRLFITMIYDYTSLENLVINDIWLHLSIFSWCWTSIC